MYFILSIPRISWLVRDGHCTERNLLLLIISDDSNKCVLICVWAGWPGDLHQLSLTSSSGDHFPPIGWGCYMLYLKSSSDNFSASCCPDQWPLSHACLTQHRCRFNAMWCMLSRLRWDEWCSEPHHPTQFCSSRVKQQSSFHAPAPV